ncbi:MAG: DUF1552 domain-containing protein [Myxococcota bacterium]
MHLLRRRDFLTGLGLGLGATALTPFARGLLQRASGQARTDRRLVFMHTINGLGHELYGSGERRVLQRWRPSGPILRPDTLATSHAPLAPWASQMSIVDELYNPFNNGQTGCGWATLAVRGSREEIGGGEQSWRRWPDPVGLTIDVYMGERLSAGLPHARIAWHADVAPMSADAAANRVPSFGHTSTAFAAIFGTFDPSTSNREIELHLMRGMSVLDTVRADLARLRSRLAPGERRAMDRFEAAIRSTERTVRAQAAEARENRACAIPTDPGLLSGPHNGAYSMEYVDAMVQIQLTALQCGLSNVAIFNPVPMRRYYTDPLGSDRHADGLAADGDTEGLTRLDQFNASLLARYIQGLEAVEEGSGTMADSTLFVWTDVNGGTHNSYRVPGRARHNHHPMITIGNPEGTFETGRYVNFAPYERSVSDGYVTLLNAVGIDDEVFGDPSACRGPLPLV